MKTFLIGFILGFVLVPVLLYAYFMTGGAPVATSAPALPFEKLLAHGALGARIAREMPKSAPFAPDEAAYTGGAQVYRQHCAVCHGYPGTSASAIAKGMYPRPPQLFHGKGVTDDEPGETYWKVANGIRLTGMPAFSQSLSQTQMWQVSFLLANADKLPDSVKQILAAVP